MRLEPILLLIAVVFFGTIRICRRASKPALVEEVEPMTREEASHSFVYGMAIAILFGIVLVIAGVI